MYKELLNNSQKVYSRLGDDISKRIYERRVLYSLTNDNRFIRDIVKEIPQIEWLRNELDMHNNQPRLIFGAGLRGKRIAEGTPFLNWNGLIDNNPQKKGSVLGGIPIVGGIIDVKNSDVYKDAVIVISNKEHQDEIIDTLMDNGVNRNNIIEFGSKYSEMLDNIYFDLPYLSNVKDEVFVDCGAFDGMSSIGFTKWAKEFRKVICFEPDEYSYSECLKNLDAYIGKDKYVIHKMGTWDRKDVLRFEASKEEFSAISDKGCTEIQVTALDEILEDEKVTFIKMDIEGSELQSLKGAQEIIKSLSPKLAISIYHLNEDIFSIPEYIISLNKNYKFFLRHYTLREWDTVLYAIPQ